MPKLERKANTRKRFLEYYPITPMYRITYGYDSKGNRIHNISYPLSSSLSNMVAQKVQYKYDDNNLLLFKVINKGDITRISLYTYYSNHLVHTITEQPVGYDMDRDKKVSHFKYDNKNNKIEQVTTVYDSYTNNIEKTNHHNFQYNDNNQLISECVITHEYDEDDEENSFYITQYYYEYDENGLLIKKKCINYKNHIREIEYKYDNGHLVYEYHTIDNVSKVVKEYTYNDDGLLIQTFSIETFDGREGHQKITYEYDDNKNLIQEEYYSRCLILMK